MTLRTAVQAILQRYDEAAFEALANRGLLRRARKDLESLPIAIAEETAQVLRLQVGDWQVRIDERGPSQAQCDCPAPGICQHILAAALWL